MKLRIPIRIPRLESISVLLIITLAFSMPFLQMLSLMVGRFVPPRLARSTYSEGMNRMVGANALLFFLEGLAVPLELGTYENVTHLVEELLKRQPNLEYIVKTYLELLLGVVDALSSIDKSLREATVLLGEGKPHDLRVKIVQIRIVIDETYGRLYSLSLSIDRVETLYGAGFRAPREILRTLTSRLADYERRTGILEQANMELDLRKPTNLTIQSHEPMVWVESTAKFTGHLESDEVPLANRAIKFTLQGKLLPEIVTDQDGGFTTNIVIGRDFGVKELTARAQYLPTGDDVSTYLPSMSNIVFIQVNYYPAKLNMTLAIDRIHVEERVHVQGLLTDLNDAPLENRVVTLFMGESSLNETKTDAGGAYQLIFTLHRPASTGIYQIFTLYTPIRDRYSGAVSEKRQIELYYLPTKISVTSYRPWLFSGEQVSVDGIVNLEPKSGPKGVMVSASLGGSAVTQGQADENGVFRITFRIPLQTSGTQDLSLSLIPPAAWYDFSTTKVNITIYNSATIAFSSVAVVICMLLLYRSPFPTYLRLRRRPRTAAATTIEMETATRQAPVRVQAPPALDLTWVTARSDNRNKIRAAYTKTRDYTSYVTGCASKPSQTHWEFLHEVKNMIKGMEPRFRELTFLFEIAEYSNKPCTAEDSEAAILDAETIFQELGGRARA